MSILHQPLYQLVSVYSLLTHNFVISVIDKSDSSKALLCSHLVNIHICICIANTQIGNYYAPWWFYRISDQNEIEDTKGVSRIRNSKKNRRNKKEKMTNND